MNIEALDLQRKEGHESNECEDYEDYEDMQDLPSTKSVSLTGKGGSSLTVKLYKGGSSSKDSDLSAQNETCGYYSSIEGKASTRQTPVAQTKAFESKLTVDEDEASESDIENVGDKRTGEVSVMIKRQAPFSLTPTLGSARKNATKKKTPQLETTDGGQYATLDGSAPVLASANIRYAPRPCIAMSNIHVEETPQHVQVTSSAFGQENAHLDPVAAQGLESSSVRELQASIAVLDHRLSAVWKSILILSVVSICAVVIASVGLYNAMALSSDADHPLRFRSGRTRHGEATNYKQGKEPKTCRPFACWLHVACQNTPANPIMHTYRSLST